jgi:hypothetical protein
MSSDDVEQKDKGGRPKEGIKFGQHKNEFGWDPSGAKTLKQAFNPENQKTAFQPDIQASHLSRPISAESHDILKYLKGKKGPKIIIESLKNKQQTAENNDLGTMLDENNIL